MNKPPEIDEVSFLHFNNPNLLPWHDKYRNEMYSNLPTSVKHVIDEWLNGWYSHKSAKKCKGHIITLQTI